MNDFTPIPLDNIRTAIKQQGVDGFLVPARDKFHSEYPPDAYRRLRAATGFTGSAGTAVFLATQQAFFTDGRYTLQADDELPPYFQHYNIQPEQPKHNVPSLWLAQNAGTDSKIGFDPWLYSHAEIIKLQKTLNEKAADKKLHLVAVDKNPIDTAWHDQPAEPQSSVFIHQKQFAGRTVTQKLAAATKLLDKNGLDAAVLTDSASVAWLLNIRGRDVACTPLPLSYAILHKNGSVEWFVDSAKTKENRADLEKHFKGRVIEKPIEQFTDALSTLGNKKVRLNTRTTPFAVMQTLLKNGTICDDGLDPTERARALRNATERRGAQEAHVRDGVALVQFLEWFDLYAPTGTINEISAADKLEEFRRAGKHFVELSFPTIAGSGANGAIIHYQAKEPNPIIQNSLFLLDSGAQYLDGTTDVTRTIVVGTASDEMKRDFTLALKGHIQLAMAVFNRRHTRGLDLSAIANAPITAGGRLCPHGIGHGVGHFMGVHDGNHSITPHLVFGGIKGVFEASMVTSNEPGIYVEGEYGIRHENLYMFRKAKGRDMLCLEPLTMAPFDVRGIKPEMLDADEKAWLNTYHERVRRTLMPLLPQRSTQVWLAQATAAI